MALSFKDARLSLTIQPACSSNPAMENGYVESFNARLREYRVLNVIDEFTHECLAIRSSTRGTPRGLLGSIASMTLHSLSESSWRISADR
jgi:hypothetical protein